MQLLFNIDLVNIAGVKVFVFAGVFTPQNCAAVDTHQWFLIINENSAKRKWWRKNWYDWRINLVFARGRYRCRFEGENHTLSNKARRRKEKINRWSHYWFCFLKDFTSFPSGERLRCFHLNDHDDDFFQRFLHLWRVFLIGNLLICSEGRKKRIKSWIKNL